MNDSLKDTANVKILCGYNLTEIKGNKFVERAELDKPYNDKTELLLDGIFVEIGGVPSSSIAASIGVKTTETGEIIIDKAGLTCVPGVFSAGDVTDTVLRQGVVAAAQGAISATSAYKFISGKKNAISW